MAGIFEQLNALIWHERFWLPVNVTWADVSNQPGSSIRYPELRDMLVPFPLALVLIVVRRVFEHFIALPIARSYRLQAHDPRSRFVPNATLESEYRRLGRRHRPDATELAELAQLAQISEREVERWFRRRRNRDKASVATRFSESFWRFAFYTSVWFYGIYVLHDKEWLWNGEACYYNFPHQSVTSDMYWYYMIESAFYWSLTLTACIDVKHADFWPMMLHHFITLSLMYISWVNNMVRVGTLILISHDLADVLLELGKVTHYLKLTRVCDNVFIGFVISWFFTRLTYYPIIVIYPAMFKAAGIINGFYYMYYIYMVLLCGLLGLHVFWFGIILKILYYQIKIGHMPGDLRSDSELEQETPNNEPEKENEDGNGTSSISTNGEAMEDSESKKHN